MNGSINDIKKIFNVFEITKYSYFFIQVKYQVEDFKLRITKDKLIINKDSFAILANEIIDISKTIDSEIRNNEVNILSNYYKSIKSLKEIDKEKSVYAKNIKSIFLEYTGEKVITLKYIQKEYFSRYRKLLSLMTISRVLKGHLKYYYRKTVLKNPKLQDNNYIIMDFIFIIGIAKALENKLDIIFIDESGFMLSNNNLYMWRKSGELICGGPKVDNKKRINLIMSISKTGIILCHYYKNETIGENEFLSFMIDLIDKIGKEDIINKIFILDNASYHLSKKIREFAEKEKLKVLFNVPYKSEFNGIELVFHLIKNNLYKEINKNMNDFSKKLVMYLDDEKISQNVLKVYKKTYEVYQRFYENNLNNINLICKEGDARIKKRRKYNGVKRRKANK